MLVSSAIFKGGNWGWKRLKSYKRVCAKTGRSKTWSKSGGHAHLICNTHQHLKASRHHLQLECICLFNTASCLGDPGRACMCLDLGWLSTETLLKGSLRHSHDFEICCFITYPLRGQEEDISHWKQPGNAGELLESEHNYPFWKLVLVISRVTPPLTAPGRRVSKRSRGSQGQDGTWPRTTGFQSGCICRARSTQLTEHVHTPIYTQT